MEQQSNRNPSAVPARVLTLTFGLTSLVLWMAVSWRAAMRLMLLGAVLGVFFVWTGIGIQIYVAACNALDARRSRRRTVRDWRERHPTSLDEFLAGCHVSPDKNALEARVAIVTRKALADYGGGLPPETIRAEDSLAEPIWDNLWWSDIYFEIERGASVRIKDWRIVDGLEVSLHRPQLKVRDLVRTVVTGAKPLDRPREIEPPAGMER